MVGRLAERLAESQERKTDRRTRDSSSKIKQRSRPYDYLLDTCISYLERLGSMSTDYSTRLMEQLLVSSRGRSSHLKQRLFTVFEKLNGTSLFAKLKFFFTAHQAEAPARVVSLFVISQLLDFTLTNFRSHARLEKLPHSAKLHRLTNAGVVIDRSELALLSEPNPHESKLR